MDMTSDMWAWLFRRVPAEQHNQLMLMTGSGTEIAVQALLRIETDFIAIKGRLSGSQDAGRIYFIPYTNIDYFGMQRDVKETEFDAIFGEGSLTPSAPVAQPTPSAAASSKSACGPGVVVPVPAAQPGVDIPVSTSVSQKTPLPLKSEVLERFRSRIASASQSLNGTSPFRPADG
jgi:hypothetical protein